MRDMWLFFLGLDGESPHTLPRKPLLSHGFGGDLISQLSSFVENSLHQSTYLYLHGSTACQEAFNRMSNLAGALLLRFTSTSSSNLSWQIFGNQRGPIIGSDRTFAQVMHTPSPIHNLTEFCSGSKGFSPFLALFGKFSSFMMKLLCREAERLQSLPLLSLATSLVPPFGNLSSKVLAIPMEKGDAQAHGSIAQRFCEVNHRGCSGFPFPELNQARHAIEPRTGIEFPVILDNGENKSSLTSEVLVGTGSRTVTIIRIKPLKVYAFGFYIQPNAVCEKLGPKYGSIPVGELNQRHDFYKDLLREDIGMTVRLVINYNGMKISTVKDAFEKSLRARLQKTNPNTDYHCLETFGSFFTKDIQLPVGTTVDFRRTTDGQLITEVGGKQIGAVHSKDLCRAFFDMYIGDVTVSEQTKEAIGKNVASIIRRC